MLSELEWEEEVDGLSRVADIVTLRSHDREQRKEIARLTAERDSERARAERYLDAMRELMSAELAQSWGAWKKINDCVEEARRAE